MHRVGLIIFQRLWIEQSKNEADARLFVTDVLITSLFEQVLVSQEEEIL